MQTDTTYDPAAPRRFTRLFLLLLLGALVATAALALFTDPFHTFGTGQVPSMLTNEREEKSRAFLHAERPPQVIVLGTSRVMKLRPACLTELTGLPAFNFAFSNALVEDWSAALRFAQARGAAPLRDVLIGVDLEAFEHYTEVDQRLRSSAYLRDYLDGVSGLSWQAATRALFGIQAFRASLSAIFYELRPGARPIAASQFGPDGFVTYTAWEAEIRRGTFSAAPLTAASVAKLEARSKTASYDELSPERVAMFRALVRSAHAAGITVYAFIPPVVPAIEEARASSLVPARTRELELMLRELEVEGALRYVPIHGVADFGGDPAGFYDGVHMTEQNASRLLLKIFERDHGCGL